MLSCQTLGEGERQSETLWLNVTKQFSAWLCMTEKHSSTAAAILCVRAFVASVCTHHSMCKTLRKSVTGRDKVSVCVCEVCQWEGDTERFCISYLAAVLVFHLAENTTGGDQCTSWWHTFLTALRLTSHHTTHTRTQRLSQESTDVKIKPLECQRFLDTHAFKNKNMGEKPTAVNSWTHETRFLYAHKSAHRSTQRVHNKCTACFRI